MPFGPWCVFLATLGTCGPILEALFLAGMGSAMGSMQPRSRTFWTVSVVGPVSPVPTRSWLAAAWSSSRPRLVRSCHCPCSARLSLCRRRVARARTCSGPVKVFAVLLLADDQAWEDPQEAVAIECGLLVEEGGLLVFSQWLWS